MAKVLSNLRITQHYGHNGHKGVDLGATDDRKVYANADGTVEAIQTGIPNAQGSTGTRSWGNFVLIKHPNGYKTRYAHLAKVLVKVGQHVTAGQQIGVQGNTGNSYGTHLHYELYDKLGTRINPEAYIQNPIYMASQTKITYSAYDNVKNKWLPTVTAGTSSYAGNLGNGISAFRVSNLTYRAHDMVKNRWLPWVTGNSFYAGNLPNNIDAIQIKGATYRTYDNAKRKWLPFVNGENGYAGNYGHAIGGIQIK